jgi:regulatory protein
MNKITNVEVQKKNKNRVNVYIDEEFAFSCDVEIVYKYGIKKNNEVNAKQLMEIMEEENFVKCKNSALRIIERTYKTEKEITDKLREKGYDEKSINRTIDFMEEYNLLNDKKYADMYIKDKIKVQGINKIKYNLLRKGVCEEVIRDKITNISKDDEKEGALKLAQKKYNQIINREQDKYKVSQKLYRFLVSKGYDYDCINEVIKKVINIDSFME